ncbi:MAG: hypothetical protein MUC36_26765 [Planctomycetes bacterium]|nr:hypothetical protein [Planctomycetota bacterium]
MSDWDDRAIDAALHELHGSRPPDLSARVLLALQEQAPAALPSLSPAKPGLPWPQLLVVLAASLLLGLGAALLVVYRSAPPAEVLEVALSVEVLAGEVACESAGVLADDRARSGAAVAHTGTAGSTLAFAAAPGRRMWCPRASTFRIGTFGVLTAMQDTELEVKDMAIGKLQGVVVASSLTLAVVAGVVTWHSLRGRRGERDVVGGLCPGADAGGGERRPAAAHRRAGAAESRAAHCRCGAAAGAGAGCGRARGDGAGGGPGAGGARDGVLRSALRRGAGEDRLGQDG